MFLFPWGFVALETEKSAVETRSVETAYFCVKSVTKPQGKTNIHYYIYVAIQFLYPFKLFWFLVALLFQSLGVQGLVYSWSLEQDTNAVIINCDVTFEEVESRMELLLLLLETKVSKISNLFSYRASNIIEGYYKLAKKNESGKEYNLKSVYFEVIKLESVVVYLTVPIQSRSQVGLGCNLMLLPWFG